MPREIEIGLYDLDTMSRTDFPPSPAGRSLPEDAVIVASCNPDEPATPAVMETLSRVLDEDERSRMAALKSDRARRQYLVAHALLRATLSRTGRIVPGGWRFGRTRAGRPVIVRPRGTSFRFSLSHTTSLIVCAVSVACPIGIDAEPVDGNRSLDELMSYALSPAEREWCESAEPPARPRRFYRLWTLKEAYLKARGTGFTSAPSSIGFRIPDDGSPVLRTVAGERERDARWSFRVFDPTPTHVCALALGVPPREDVALTWARVRIEDLVAAFRVRGSS